MPSRATRLEESATVTVVCRYRRPSRVQGIIRVTLDLRRAHSDPDPHWRAPHSLTRYVSPVLAYGLCLWLGSDLWEGRSEVLSSIMLVVFLLLLSASSNCRDLLEAIGMQRGAVAPDSRG